jgi:HEAT repeat protein
MFGGAQMSDWREKLAADTRDSGELLQAHRRERGCDDVWEAMSTLQYRGGQAELELGLRLTQSDDADDRCIGADLLGQLGWERSTHLDETVAALIGLLTDPDPHVIYCAAIGLGHRCDPRAVGPLIELAAHPDPEVRFGVASGLLAQEDERAVRALIGLSSDVDCDVRNWATFGLGTQIECDSPAIREALAARLDDADQEIRGEALVGLARRRDSRTRAALLHEWERSKIGILSLEAAELLADPALEPALRELLPVLGQDDDRFARQLRAAIEASAPPAEQSYRADDSQVGATLKGE